jgi:dTDP-4-amino-4,6-dideoxygalactose transaminase
MSSKLFAVPRGRVNLSLAQANAAVSHLWDTDEGVVRRFEDAFARYIGVPHAVAVGSAKAGLSMLLKSLGARPGDGVIVPGYNVPEVPAVLRAMGLRVIAGDVDPQTYNISVKEVERYASEARFLIVTHLYGNPADLEGLSAVARRHGLTVIEDCAQALGAGYKGKRLGASGNPAIFSFGLMKNLTALGGGMVTTTEIRIAGKLREFRAVGRQVSTNRLVDDLIKGMAVAAGTSGQVFPFLFGMLRLTEQVAPGLIYRIMKFRPPQWDEGKLDLGGLNLRLHPCPGRGGPCWALSGGSGHAITGG